MLLTVIFFTMYGKNGFAEVPKNLHTVKFNTNHMSQTVHLNFSVNLTQDEYVRNTNTFLYKN